MGLELATPSVIAIFLLQGHSFIAGVASECDQRMECASAKPMVFAFVLVVAKEKPGVGMLWWTLGRQELPMLPGPLETERLN